MLKKKLDLTLLIIFISAFLVRLINLNQSLWLDEATTARVVQQYNFLEILTKFSPFDFHPPLYYWLMKVWTNIFGYSEISLRFPSVIFAILTGYVVYRIASLLYGSFIGKWSMVFFLFNPLIIYYSQEARSYMMVTFLITTGLYYLVKLIFDTGQIKRSKFKVQSYSLKFKINLILLNLFLILSFLTFYGSIFFIITVLIYLLVKKQYKLFFFSGICYLSSIILLSPLLYQQILNAKVSLSSVTNWSLVLGKTNLKNLLLIPIKFSFGRISLKPKLIYYLISGIWTALVWFYVIKGGFKEKKLILIMVITIIIATGISFFTPLLQYFRFLYLIPIMSILLSIGLMSQAQSDLGGQQRVVATGFVILSLAYLLIPKFHREDWKGLAKTLPKNSTVHMIKPSSDPLVYYRQDIKVEELRNLRLQDYTSAKELTIIPYTSEIYGLDYKKTLSDFSLKNQYDFIGVTYEIWVKN